MKISKSKQELARIISENGGWRDGAEFAAQDQNAAVTFFVDTPWRCGATWEASEFEAVDGFGVTAKALTNWHQTVLSRDEYFFLYQNQGLEDALDEPLVRAETKPTIEQLIVDCRDRKDYADRKQEEADAAKADANEALRKLEIAGEAIGLLVSPITEKQEPELVIGVQVCDEVECVESNIKRDKYNGMVGRLHTIDESDTYTPYLVDFGNKARIWCHEVKFIRRP